MIIPRAQLLPIHVEAKEPRHDKPILAIIVLITSSSKSQNVSKFSNSDSSFLAESKYVSKINKSFQFFKLHAHVAKNITHERSHSDLPGSNCESSSGWFFLCSDIIFFRCRTRYLGNFGMKFEPQGVGVKIVLYFCHFLSFAFFFVSFFISRVENTSGQLEKESEHNFEQTNRASSV